MIWVAIIYGAIAPGLSEQVEAQGYMLPGVDAVALQADADAVCRLSIRGLLTESATHSARQKIVKRVGKAVVPHD